MRKTSFKVKREYDWECMSTTHKDRIMYLYGMFKEIYILLY
jgi:hypothetical protein